MTPMSLRARWALLALLGVALLATAGTPALADEEEVTEEVEVVEEVRQLKVFVTTEDGEQTVKVLRLEDGKWVPAEDSDAAAPIRVRRRMGRGPGTGSVVVERAAAAGTKAETPLPTILRWLFEDVAQEKDPLDAWFAAGDNVPLAHLRNALKRDGWTPDRLRSWMYEMVESHLTSFLANHASHARHAGHAKHGMGGGMGGSDHASRGCPNCPCAHCRSQRQPPPCPTCGHHGPSARAAQPQHRAYVIWNDGSGWRQQAMPAPFPGGGHPGMYGAPPPPPAPHMGMPHGPRGRGAAHPGEPGGPAEGHAAILTEIAPLLPQLLGVLQDLDPDTREMLMKQLAGLGIHALGDAAPKDGASTK